VFCVLTEQGAAREQHLTPLVAQVLSDAERIPRDPAASST
jgi:hypothetical protein